MSATTILARGVRWRPDGTLQVRIAGFKPKGGFTDPDDANAYAAELRNRKREGILVAPAAASAKLTLLKTMAEAHLDKLATTGGKRKRPYTAAGLGKARQAHRPWLGVELAAYSVQDGYAEVKQPVNGDGVPFGELPLAALDPAEVELYLQARYAQTPRAAVGELQALHAILTLARRRGEKFDDRLLAIEPLKLRPRVQPGIEPHHVAYMAAFVPEHQRRLFLLGRTLGSRIMELLNAEDAWLDVDASTLTIPAWATKEKREKVLRLLPEELHLLRAQQLARSANAALGRDGTRLLFPRKLGSAWSHSAFWEDVIKPARRKAAKQWRVDHGLSALADTPFEYAEVYADTGEPILVNGRPKIGGFGPHDLRRCAATTLLDAEVKPALVAARFGHKDNGELVTRLYAKDKRAVALDVELAAIAAQGGLDARLAAAAGGRA